MPLDPQATAVLDLIESAGGPRLDEMTPVDARALYESMAEARTSEERLGAVEDLVIAGPGGDLPLRLYRPEGEGPFPVSMYFHGGGWVIGSIASHDALCQSLASRSGAAVVSVEYRLAPEAPFPAALEDCYVATAHVADNAARLGFDPSRLAVSGDSAGGNLAASTCLLARDRGGPALAFQLLVYPATDHAYAFPSCTENGEGYFLTLDAMRWFSAHYLSEPGDGKDPLASPLLAEDLSGLPPALVITAEFDPLRDEGEAYAARLAEAGVKTEVHRYDGMIHGFLSMAVMLDQGATAVEECATALRIALAHPTPEV
ncbi:MAG: alpha/beta hydrolase [Acidimicrobiia bacterium]|nr:alpha/beta hydrolase [Acidimicrobiia bacterium]